MKRGGGGWGWGFTRKIAELGRKKLQKKSHCKQKENEQKKTLPTNEFKINDANGSDFSRVK